MGVGGLGGISNLCSGKKDVGSDLYRILQKGRESKACQIERYVTV